MLEKKNSGTWSWFLQRVTALFLAIGLLVHFWILHYIIERPLTFSKIVNRLSSTGWIIFDSLLLVACIYHAFNGLYAIFLDFKPDSTYRKTLYYLLLIMGIVLSVFGLSVLVPYY